MTALVLNMADFRTIFSPAEEAREQVARQIDHRCTIAILAKAQQIAAAETRKGVHPNVAAARAVSWALAQVEPTSPEVA